MAENDRWIEKYRSAIELVKFRLMIDRGRCEISLRQFVSVSSAREPEPVALVGGFAFGATLQGVWVSVDRLGRGHYRFWYRLAYDEAGIVAAGQCALNHWGPAGSQFGKKRR